MLHQGIRITVQPKSHHANNMKKTKAHRNKIMLMVSRSWFFLNFVATENLMYFTKVPSLFSSWLLKGSRLNGCMESGSYCSNSRLKHPLQELDAPFPAPHRNLSWPMFSSLQRSTSHFRILKLILN